jgi:replicative DNA helicase
MSDTEIEIQNVGYLIDPLIVELGKRKDTPELQITSLPSLNNLIWGIKKRKLTVIGARTSQGKSSFAVQLCFDLAMQDKKVVFFSLEMENLECAERLLSHALEINNIDLLKGAYAGLKQTAEDFRDKLLSKNFLISDCMGHGWKEIQDIIELWHKNNTVPDMVVLDYIQNVRGQGNDKQVFDEYIQKFREMAIHYNFAAVICSQVNRTSQETDDKSPQLHQLKGTGRLEEAADIVFLLHWPYFYNRNKDRVNNFELYVAKNKLGQTGRLNIYYYPEHFKFSEIQRHPEPINYNPTPPDRNWQD